METLLYKQQAYRLDNEKALRVVASTNGENPISILIPCHHVVGSDGSLVGTLRELNKKILLNLEKETVITKNK